MTQDQIHTALKDLASKIRLIRDFDCDDAELVELFAKTSIHDAPETTGAFIAKRYKRVKVLILPRYGYHKELGFERILVESYRHDIDLTVWALGLIHVTPENIVKPGWVRDHHNGTVLNLKVMSGGGPDERDEDQVNCDYVLECVSQQYVEKEEARINEYKRQEKEKRLDIRRHAQSLASSGEPNVDMSIADRVLTQAKSELDDPWAADLIARINSKKDRFFELAANYAHKNRCSDEEAIRNQQATFNVFCEEELKRTICECSFEQVEDQDVINACANPFPNRKKQRALPRSSIIRVFGVGSACAERRLKNMVSRGSLTFNGRSTYFAPVAA